jgi:UDP:flavonoid glycosyltransferase YjiC (YdhE family)
MHSMRVLFSSAGMIGHVNPMVPLADAVRSRGHELRWAVGPESCERVEQAGLAAVPAGLTQAERLAEFWRRHAGVRELPPEQRPDVMFSKLFGEVSVPAALPALLELAKSWRPELVVHDTAELAAPIAAAAIGVPHVAHSFGALLPEIRLCRAADEVAPLWREQGLEPRPHAGAYDHLYLDIYPSSLQPPGGDHVGARQQLRPVAFAGATDGEASGDFLKGLPRPLVYLTFGTVFDDVEAFRAALEGIAALDVGVVATVGPNVDPAAVGPQPGKVLVERYIPQTRLLPACAVVVSHAGSGTFLAALALGIPQLCLPHAADQFLNAAAVERAGAGLAIAPGEVDAGAVEAAVRRLLDEPGFRESARRVADEIAVMPSPDDVAGVLETMARSASPPRAP